MLTRLLIMHQWHLPAATFLFACKEYFCFHSTSNSVQRKRISVSRTPFARKAQPESYPQHHKNFCLLPSHLPSSKVPLVCR